MTVSPRRDGTGVPVGWFAVPKFGQKNALPRGDATEMPVGVVAVLRTASRVGLRIVLRDRSKINLMTVEDRLWDGSWWRNRDPSWPPDPACTKIDDLACHRSETLPRSPTLPRRPTLPATKKG